MDVYHRNGYHRYLKKARQHLADCADNLTDCGMILDSLEGILENSPKPSELLGYIRIGGEYVIQRTNR
ncbi:MAG: hypothetical protein PHR56_07825 [Dehalococcoidales bacterium]|nr:hypothetical protein [Dehalococcoidales bacterium]